MSLLALSIARLPLCQASLNRTPHAQDSQDLSLLLLWGGRVVDHHDYDHARWKGFFPCFRQWVELNKETRTWIRLEEIPLYLRGLPLKWLKCLGDHHESSKWLASHPDQSMVALSLSRVFQLQLHTCLANPRGMVSILLVDDGRRTFGRRCVLSHRLRLGANLCAILSLRDARWNLVPHLFTP